MTKATFSHTRAMNGDCPSKRLDEDPDSELNVLRREVRQLQAQVRDAALQVAVAEEEAKSLRGSLVSTEAKLDDSLAREAQLLVQLDAQRVRRQRVESTLAAAESLVSALRDMAIDDGEHDEEEGDEDEDVEDNGRLAELLNRIESTQQQQQELLLPESISNTSQQQQERHYRMSLPIQNSISGNAIDESATNDGEINNDSHEKYRQRHSSASFIRNGIDDKRNEDGEVNDYDDDDDYGEDDYADDDYGDIADENVDEHVVDGPDGDGSDNGDDRIETPQSMTGHSSADIVIFGKEQSSSTIPDEVQTLETGQDEKSTQLHNDDREVPVQTVNGAQDEALFDAHSGDAQEAEPSQGRNDGSNQPLPEPRLQPHRLAERPVAMMVSATGGILRRHSSHINRASSSSNQAATTPSSPVTRTAAPERTADMMPNASGGFRLLRHAFGSVQQPPATSPSSTTSTAVTDNATAGSETGTVTQGSSQPASFSSNPRSRCVSDAHAGDILCVASSNDGRLVATSGDEKCIRIYNQSVEPVCVISGLSKAITALAFIQTPLAANDATLSQPVSQSQDRQQRKRVRSTSTPFTLPTTKPSGTSENANGYILLGGGSDGVIRLFRPMPFRRNKMKWEPTNLFPLHTGGIRRLHTSIPSSPSSSCKILSCSLDRHIKICDAEQMKRPSFSVCTPSPVLDVDYVTADWSCLVSAHKDGSLRLISTRDSTPIVSTAKNHSRPIISVKCVRDESKPDATPKLIVSLSKDHVVRVSDIRFGVLTAVRDLDLGCLVTSEWQRLHTRDRLVAAGHGFHGQLRVWNIDSGKIIKTLEPTQESPEGHTSVLDMVSRNLRDPGGVIIPHWTSSRVLVCAHHSRQVSAWDM